MGMSSSQARLLSLTSRMHDIEYKAQKLEAQKLQMANESAHVYKKYEDALNMTTIQAATIGADGSVKYIDTTLFVIEGNAANKIAQEMYLKDVMTDKIYVSRMNADKFKLPEDGNPGTEYEFMNRLGFKTAILGFDKIDNSIPSEKYSGATTTNDPNGSRVVPAISKSWGVQDITHQTPPAGSVSISSITDNKFVAGTTYTIGTLEDLKKLQDMTNSGVSTQGIKFMLTNNIDMSSIANWTGIGNSTTNAFKGIFDGNGYTISGLNSTSSGLFKYVTGDQVSVTNKDTGVQTTSSYGIIKNVTLTDVNIVSTTDDIGALIGTTNKATIDNCETSGYIKGRNHIGGLVGNNVNTAISQSTSNVTIEASGLCIGGFTGHDTNGILSNCVSTGDVSTTYYDGWIGGFIGHETSRGTTFIYECATTSKVTGKNKVGLFIGNIDSNSKANINGSLYSDSTGSSTDKTIGYVTNESTQIIGDTPLSSGATKVVRTNNVSVPTELDMLKNIVLLLDKAGLKVDTIVMQKTQNWLSQFYKQNPETPTALDDMALKLASINDFINNELNNSVVNTDFVSDLMSDINNNTTTATVAYQNNYESTTEYEYTAIESQAAQNPTKTTSITIGSKEDIANNLYTALRNIGHNELKYTEDINKVQNWVNSKFNTATVNDKLALAELNNIITTGDQAELEKIMNAINTNSSYTVPTNKKVYTDSISSYSVNMVDQNQNYSSDWDMTDPQIVEALDYYQIIKGGYIIVENEQAASTEWLSNMINMGMALFTEYDKTTYTFTDTNIATNTKLQEVSNEIELKKAEAEYEAAMRKIDDKDKKYDVELAYLENERNAIKTEMDTLKTVVKDNVDRTFKLFG